MTGLAITRLICSHDFYWSRRRHADVCRRCGLVSKEPVVRYRAGVRWTIGAELPPEAAPAEAPASKDDSAAGLSLPASRSATTDFSNGSAAPLRRPLVTGKTD